MVGRGKMMLLGPKEAGSKKKKNKEWWRGKMTGKFAPPKKAVVTLWSTPTLFLWNFRRFMIQGDQLNMAVLFWYLVKTKK